MLKLHPDELVRLAPRLRLYLRRPSPAWPEIVDAADWLRHGLDVSKPLRGEACLAMGRDRAGGVTTGDLERPLWPKWMPWWCVLMITCGRWSLC